MAIAYSGLSNRLPRTVDRHNWQPKTGLVPLKATLVPTKYNCSQTCSLNQLYDGMAGRRRSAGSKPCEPMPFWQRRASIVPTRTATEDALRREIFVAGQTPSANPASRSAARSMSSSEIISTGLCM